MILLGHCFAGFALGFFRKCLGRNECERQQGQYNQKNKLTDDLLMVSFLSRALASAEPARRHLAIRHIGEKIARLPYVRHGAGYVSKGVAASLAIDRIDRFNQSECCDTHRRIQISQLLTCKSKKFRQD